MIGPAVIRRVILARLDRSQRLNGEESGPRASIPARRLPNGAVATKMPTFRKRDPDRSTRDRLSTRHAGSLRFELTLRTRFFIRDSFVWLRLGACEFCC